MEYMQGCKENEFDLAVVDPPYGIDSFNRPSRIQRYGQMETVNNLNPDEKYFEKLKSVSTNQIIWGYNHLADLIGPTKEFIFWQKHQPVKTYSDGELAYTSFNSTAKCFDYPFFGAYNSESRRIHPTQKPVTLYNWIYKNYAKKNDKILDTHLGSASSAIAAHYAGLEFVGMEIDKEYFGRAVERFKRETRQLTLI